MYARKIQTYWTHYVASKVLSTYFPTDNVRNIMSLVFAKDPREYVWLNGFTIDAAIFD